MPKTQKIFYDTEFLETYKEIDLISIGMIREDGKEFYAVSSEFNTLAVAKHSWLMDNVMTSIGHKIITSHVTGTGQPVPDLELGDPALMTRRQIRQGILEFCHDIRPDFWAWYGAYDHVALCQLFGTMVDLPAKFPMFTSDLKQLVKMAGNPDMPQQSDGKHNALDDARFNLVRYGYLMKLMDGKVLRYSGKF